MCLLLLVLTNPIVSDSLCWFSVGSRETVLRSEAVSERDLPRGDETPPGGMWWGGWFALLRCCAAVAATVAAASSGWPDSHITVPVLLRRHIRFIPLEAIGALG
jgi:hypothetical protein